MAAAAATGCPFLDGVLSRENTTPCVITSFIRFMDVLMMSLAPDLDPNSGYPSPSGLFLSHRKPYEEGPVRERVYRTTFEISQRDSKRDIVLSEDRNSRMSDLILNGGDTEGKLSFSFSDGNDNQDLMSLSFKVKDMKQQAFFISMIGRLIDETDGLPVGDYSPTRTIVERHFQYRPNTIEEGESSHRDVLEKRVCDWTIVKSTTPESRDDIHNFVYGGVHEEKTILYFEEPKRHRRMVPKEEFFIFSKIVGDALV